VRHRFFEPGATCFPGFVSSHHKNHGVSGLTRLTVIAPLLSIPVNGAELCFAVRNMAFDDSLQKKMHCKKNGAANERVCGLREECYAGFGGC
jgi:hypothetical protein